ncbi:hypothetical protein WMY93_027754 [Mugilogobius chulae]|uniref:Lipoxygenase domain-containing protein n=1 Tax=Mugilogobius chulae TaxID=88201 RepID=A0AAW0MUZ2_9GOBI
MAMAKYQLEVSTGDMEKAGTWDHILVTLIGTLGQSEKTKLDGWGRDFGVGSTGQRACAAVAGEPVVLPQCPGAHSRGDTVLFPCYRWISRGERVELRKAKATKIFEEDHPMQKEHRQKEMTERKELYRFKVFEEGLPYRAHYDSVEEGLEMMLKGMVGSQKRWENEEEMRNIFWMKKTPITEYVADHWREDDFYGSQFLNGYNPMVIHRCQELPLNFPVTNEMVQPFLDGGHSLTTALEAGNIFLYDAKKFEGIPPRTYNGRALHVTPGLCLFYLNSEKQLKPIAIQLYQKPAEDNPIFLPSDLETDWLLAKMFIKNAVIMEHQSVNHLMNTHLLVEVFIIAMLRNLPTVHPIYKCSVGSKGLKELMKRSFSELTYSDLCLPENITSRGLDSVPNFYYRDDGLTLWAIIHSFAQAVIEHFYPSNADVQRDSELQDWISEIFTYGFWETKNQFDYQTYLPNVSLLLVSAPPTTKGQSTMQSVLDALPNVGDTGKITTIGWLLSAQYSDLTPLGTYTDERFDDPILTQMMKEFQAQLSNLEETITQRNKGLPVPYTYLLPSQVENSIAI